MGVEFLETVNNRHKKAGALGQARSGLLPHRVTTTLVMVMDADTSTLERRASSRRRSAG